MIGAAYEQDTLTALSNAPVVTPPVTPPKFSMWGMTTAAPRGLTGGAAESAGFFADIAGAYGQVVAATDPMISVSAPKDVREKLAQGQKEAHDKLINEGVDFSSEAGDIFREVARGYRRDPNTTHAAEKLVFDLFRFGGKAVGYTIGAGPAGPLLFGADEGFTAADDLKQQGVDLGTRTKAGALHGAVSAGAVALPIAGRTIAETVALTAAGGPLSFSGEQAATAWILDNAGYDQLAEQYDPFDPIGLAVSTLVPAGFGAAAMRGAAKRAAMPQTHVDAARVALEAQEGRAQALAEPSDFPNLAKDTEATARASEQIASGERVEVLRDAPDTPLAASKLTTMAQAVRESIESAARPALEREAAMPTREPVQLPETESAGAEPSPIAQVVRQALDELRAGIEEMTGQPLARAEAESPAPNPMQARLAEVEARHPGLMIRAEGMDAPVPMADFMAQAREAAARETSDADLVQVAAECAIRMGA